MRAATTRPGRRPAAFLWAALALAAAVPLLAPALAQSGEALGVAPDRVAVLDAQAGETYVRGVTLQHQFDSSGTIRVEVDGPESAWVSTDPASPFTMPPRTNRAIAVTIAVPANASPGGHNTTLRFVREAQRQPSGTGNAVEVSAGVHLDLTVGGQPVERISYLDARVEDAQQGDAVHAFVRARNDGNVRSTAQASGQVLPFEADSPALGDATGSLVLRPGEEGEVPLVFTAALEPAQYRARLAAQGFDATLPFKVAPRGQVAPDGVLRAITHVPRPPAGRPVDVALWFQDTGNVSIAAAVAHVEVHRGGQDGEVLTRLESAPSALAAGGHANLTVVWSPPDPGTYTLVGRVTYDGYVTLPNTDLLTAVPGGAPFPWWFVILVAIAALAVLVSWAWRKGRDRQKRKPR